MSRMTIPGAAAVAFAVLIAALSVSIVHATPQVTCNAQTSNCAGCYSAGCYGYYHNGFGSICANSTATAPTAAGYTPVSTGQCQALSDALANKRCQDCVSIPTQTNVFCPTSYFTGRCLPSFIGANAASCPVTFVANGNYSGCPLTITVQTLYTNGTVALTQNVDDLRQCLVLAPMPIVYNFHIPDTYVTIDNPSSPPSGRVVTVHESCTGSGCSACDATYGHDASGSLDPFYSGYYHYTPGGLSVVFWITTSNPINPYAVPTSSSSSSSTGTNAATTGAVASGSAVLFATALAIAGARF